jgi:hypothetical protein
MVAILAQGELMSFDYKLCSLELNFGNDKKVLVGDLYIDPLNIPNRDELDKIFSDLLLQGSMTFSKSAEKHG